ncbi:MAG: phage tail assembly chaperone [Desulfovibrio sp.]|nr:phage tail assembly chaperone [Desulfovibrio sp.]
MIDFPFDSPSFPVYDTKSRELVYNHSEEEMKATYSTDLRWYTLRQNRDKLLAETDYMVMPDYPITKEKLAKVKTYRQALRDLPSQEGAPWDGGKLPGEPDCTTPWPTKPE